MRQPAATARDGTLTLRSRTLGLELRAAPGREMRFRDPATGCDLLSHDEEAEARRTEVEARRAEAEARRAEAEARRAAETRAAAAEARATAAEARVTELETRLRGRYREISRSEPDRR